MNPFSNKSLRVPDKVNFTCQNSGTCCSVFETIPADKHTVETINRVGEETLLSAAGKSTDKSILKVNEGTDITISRDTCGQCSMYGSDQLCAIHKVAGKDAKPQVCKDFPYRFVETEGGVFVGLSFVCPTVRKNMGAALKDQEQKIAEHYTVAKSVLESPRRIMLNRRLAMSWEDYVLLEQSFQDILDNAGEKLSVRVIACCVLINLIDQYIITMAKDPVVMPESYLPSGVIAQLTNELKDKGYKTVFEIARKPRGKTFVARRMFLGMFVSFANTLQKSRGRFRTVVSVMGSYIRHATGWGRLNIQPFEKVAYRELEEVNMALGSTAEDLMQRYVKHCIWRKDLILEGNVARRLRLMALNAALIPWYAKARAMKEKHGGVQDEDISEAIATVERLYGFHSSFFRFFEQNQIFDDIVESFLLKPNYPFVILQKK